VIELFKKVREVLRRASMDNGKSKTTDPVAILTESYRDILTLAAQISSHADRAPYPHVARLLRRIAQEKQSSADLVRQKLVGSVTRQEEIPFDIKSGKNHWERMAQDLNDHKALEGRLLERAALLDEEARETAELLRQIATSHRPHMEALLDLIARADPQAEQT
jgi:rubrerythrin